MKNKVISRYIFKSLLRKLIVLLLGTSFLTIIFIILPNQVYINKDGWFFLIIGGISAFYYYKKIFPFLDFWTKTSTTYRTIILLGALFILLVCSFQFFLVDAFSYHQKVPSFENIDEKSYSFEVVNNQTNHFDFTLLNNIYTSTQNRKQVVNIDSYLITLVATTEKKSVFIAFEKSKNISYPASKERKDSVVEVLNNELIDNFNKSTISYSYYTLYDLSSERNMLISHIKDQYEVSGQIILLKPHSASYKARYILSLIGFLSLFFLILLILIFVLEENFSKKQLNKWREIEKTTSCWNKR